MTTAFSTKQPSESFPISFDFTARLGTETIASAVITAVDTSTLVDTSATILDVTKQTIIGSLVYGYVQAGTSGHNYLITCRITGSLGAVYELEGVLPIEETPTDIEEEGTGPNLASLIADIQAVIKDDAYTDAILTTRINDAVTSIAGGIRMPDQSISPPLPDLYTTATVATTAFAYASLPTNYQRNLFKVVDSSGNKINHPRGGDYYAFNLFLNQSCDKNLAETGFVYRVCAKGRKLYYQGIPATTEAIGLHYYKKPTPMVTGTDEPDGIPEHLQLRLIKHHVIMNIMGEMLEAGVGEPAIGMNYHKGKFYEAMIDLVDYIGQDGEPMYYGTDNDDDGWGSM